MSWEKNKYYENVEILWEIDSFEKFVLRRGQNIKSSTEFVKKPRFWHFSKKSRLWKIANQKSDYFVHENVLWGYPGIGLGSVGQIGEAQGGRIAPHKSFFSKNIGENGGQIY